MNVSVIGGGLAGCEAAWQLAHSGHQVTIYEMKPQKFSPAHTSPYLAELVCSNSLKATRLGSAAGMLKEEMRLLGSLILPCAEATAVGAGGALAVDRDRFSRLVTERIHSCQNIRVVNQEVTKLCSEPVVVATGPLTSDAFAEHLFGTLCDTPLSFYDAAAPIVTADSIDMERAFFGARYGRGEPDYINCPMHREEYEAFYEALVNAEVALLHNFDRPAVYEGCMPIEIMAKRGKDAMRFGPLRPVGLFHPKTQERYYAVLQLRKENAAGTLYNLVGFQTNLKFGEQKRVFSMIPALSHADFVRYGVMHRNTFLNSPRLLNRFFQLKGRDGVYFAGQITGVEGYLESAASGILAGRNLANELAGLAREPLPDTTMLGALSGYISDETISCFQPMGANMGLLPPLSHRIRNKQERYEAIARRGTDDLRDFLEREKAGVSSETSKERV